ncbi:hypothetical protein [Stenotrophomonas phage RAS14]
MSFRHDVLAQLGIENEYAAVFCRSVKVQRLNEREPFAEVTINAKGHTVLRVGNDLRTDAPVVKIK